MGTDRDRERRERLDAEQREAIRTAFAGWRRWNAEMQRALDEPRKSKADRTSTSAATSTTNSSNGDDHAHR